MDYERIHIPVLVKEVMHYLNLKKGDIVFDGTLGGAGHTIEMIKVIAPTGKIIGVDLDSQALSTATSNLKSQGLINYVCIVNDNFANVISILKKLGIKKIDGFLLDLGLSSIQIDKSGRGFSYLKKEKLDMRFDLTEGISAFEIVNKYSEEKLREIFYKYGEERWSGRIAKNIIGYRKNRRIEYSDELVEIIKRSIPDKYRYRMKGHPAKRVFQAIRIEVNRELENLEKAIKEGLGVLDTGARMAIISYHSLEDRIVKNRFEIYSGKCVCPRGFPVCNCGATKIGRILTKKAIKTTPDEGRMNPKSKSAKLRVFEKL
jgi:16S rRNA (cytosine1402-N4)-methyltransferase